MKHILQLLGLRTDCCNAKIVTWHHDRHYCAHCKRWLDRPVEQTSAKVRQQTSEV